MPVFDENQFSNPQLFAGRPPEIPECPPAHKELLKGFWFLNHGTMGIEDTDCESLKVRAEDNDRRNIYLVKKIHTKEVAPETTISGYRPFDQFGMLNFRKKIDGMNSGILVESSGSFINTPYHSSDRRENRNGVKGLATTVDEATLPYRWDLNMFYDTDSITIGTAEAVRRRKDLGRLSASEDGSIALAGAKRSGNDIYRVKLHIPTSENRRQAEDTAKGVNKCVNAFTLVLGIQPGSDTDLSVLYPVENTTESDVPPPPDPDLSPLPPSPVPPAGVSSVVSTEPWFVVIEFGDVTVEILEGRAEAKITFASNNMPITTHHVSINPSAASKSTTNFGPQPYHLTFIPVWNGVLFSDSEPTSDTWEDRFIYFPKNTKKNAASEVHDIMEKAAQENPPRWGEDGEFLPTPENRADDGVCRGVTEDKTGLIVLPDKEEYQVKFGETVKIVFGSCGGSFQFKPVYFSQMTETHLLLQADDGCVDDADACAERPYDNDRLKGHYVVPVVHYSSEGECKDDFSIRSGIYNLGEGQAKPLATVSTEIARCSQAYRRPVEMWGSFLYAIQKPEDAGRSIFRNGEGVLRNADLPIDRVQNLSVSRSLDGGQGTLKWDRFDPGTGLEDRPTQHVGAVRLTVDGGVNTSGGVLFTGIAMGNAQQNTASANEIELELHGREVKMTDSDGGLRLIHTPFFDGYDHVEVLEYLCCYAGIPCISFAKPYKLPAAASLMSEPVVNFKTGTPIWDAIGELQKLAGTLAYFDRFGVLNYRDVETTTGVNWDFPDAKVESYDDKPDLTQMRDTVLLAGMVATGDIDARAVFGGDPDNIVEANPVLVTLRIPTTPVFPWSKMMFYVIPSIMKPEDLRKQARQISKGVSRPRSAGSVVIPGNANIELLDTVNETHVVTGITHNVDINGKKFSTSLNLELLSEGNEGVVVNACGPDGGIDDLFQEGRLGPAPPAPTLTP